MYKSTKPLVHVAMTDITYSCREVIEKKPEEFKISCMKDIKSLFSHDASLYAGFGNKINVCTLLICAF